MLSRRVLLALTACVALGASALAQDKSIVVASTTSTQDSGLFDHILPLFKAKSGIEVKVVAQGTGQALNTGPLYRLPFGQLFFRGVSTGAIGALKGMLDAYIEYGKKRIQRTSGAAASEDMTIQITCAETAMK